MPRRAARLSLPPWMYQDFEKDLWRGLVLAIALEVIFHVLKPKEAAVTAVDSATASMGGG